MLRRASEADPTAGDLLSYVSNNQVQWVAAPAGVTDHGALTGLGDDDHTQYALLVGRSGGQTISGGTAGVAPTITIDEDANYYEFTEGTQDKCRVYNSAAFTHNSTGNWLEVTFDSERFDPNAMHDTSTNTTRITAVNAGYYLIGGSVTWTANATGRRIIRILYNNTTQIAGQEGDPTTNTALQMSVATFYQLAATDYVEFGVYQNSGGNLNVNATGNTSPEFWVVKVA
jgi:hypothetical protein